MTSVVAVVVSYRTAPLAAACLRSIAREREQAEADVRAIVVDNASGDAGPLRECVRSEGFDGWATVIEAPRNGGYAYGNNLAFRHVYETGGRPDYFHLLNPDTELRPGALGELVRFLESRPDAGIAGSSFENEDGSNWHFVFRFPNVWAEIDAGLEWGLASKLLANHLVAQKPATLEPQPADWLPGASLLIRRELLQAIGGLDEAYFLYFEETDFCWRAKQAGFGCWYVPSSRVMHIAGQSTKMTERNAAPKRLPRYWFDSRRRFFTRRYGIGYAVATDAARIATSVLGSAKRLLQGRSAQTVPSFLQDFVASSAIWPKNRVVGKPDFYRPPG